MSSSTSSSNNETTFPIILKWVHNNEVHLRQVTANTSSGGFVDIKGRIFLDAFGQLPIVANSTTDVNTFMNSGQRIYRVYLDNIHTLAGRHLSLSFFRGIISQAPN